MTTSVSPLAPRKPRLCINLHQAQCTRIQTSTSKEPNGRQLTNSLIAGVHCHVVCILTTKAFGRLCPTVRDRRDFTVLTNGCPHHFRTSIIFMRGMDSRHARKLNHFHTTSLRQILNIRWQGKNTLGPHHTSEEPSALGWTCISHA